LWTSFDMTGWAGSVFCRRDRSDEDENVIMVVAPSYKLVKRFVWPGMALMNGV
jgi:hypothetical protein